MPSSFPLATAVAVITLAAPSIPDGQVMSVDGKGASDDDRIGFSIAIEGKQLISGTPGESLFNGVNSGYVNAYRQVGSSWQWVYEGLTTDELEAGDEFGWSVDLSGKYAIVGAPGDDDQATQAGAAYVFVRGSNGRWAVEDKLVQSELPADSNFGFAVATNGKVTIVGAPFDSTSGAEGGSFHRFARQNDGSWIWEGSSYATGTNHLGWSVALDAKYVLIGEPGKNADRGSVRTGIVSPTGVLQSGSALTADDGVAGDEFGTSVAISGKYAIVGAPKVIVNGVGAGAAYVFARRGNGEWVQEDKLTGVSVAGGDNFGISVSISGTTAVVGASRDNTTNGVNSGSYYVFKRTSSGDWALVAGPVIAEDGLADAEFGAAVAIDKKNVAVGAPQHSNATGRSYVFR